MDSNNWRAAQGQVQIPGQVIGGEAVAAVGMEGGDWRTQLQPDFRQWILNKITETLKRHIPFAGEEGLQELKKIAVIFEERIYAAATSQLDYLRKISLKMIMIETKFQNPTANFLQSNPASNSENPQDPAQGQVQIPGQVIGGEAVAAVGMEGGDWRTQLQPDFRQWILNKITETLKRHIPFAGEEGLQELKKIAVIFEERIYAAATSQLDYLRKISLKMIMIETKSQNPTANFLQSNPASNSGNPPDPAQGQVQIPRQVIGGEAVVAVGMEGGDWRAQLLPDSRQRIVNKITETLKRHIPFDGEEGLQELKKIAVRFEERIYAAATSQVDYLRKISLKMFTMEMKSQNPTANSLQSSAASNSENSQDPVKDNPCFSRYATLTRQGGDLDF
ncbi:hypothetical protein BUALT_Bualt19G0081300 [Buddleja alternifolia]|uniref:Mediator complex subunit 15 KIX domain-containing protein n=1 Tax=Buddleja alternifolia TaxID=168488 RepID=A0AAV6WAI9_9LAMI|nr:hypothetical protein BUALT_Bualt19G0081300 [Buddleja alternifolia]